MNNEITKSSFKKILVIDDNPTDRFIAKRMAEKYQFTEEIILKESAIDALEYLQELEEFPKLLPQLIFLDINMPEMDGYEFLEEYGKLSETIKENCIVIMITSSIHPDDLKRAEDNPYVNRFVNKPIDKEKLRLIEEDFLLKKQSS